MATSTTPNLEFLQRNNTGRIFKRGLGTKTLDLQWEAQEALYSF